MRAPLLAALIALGVPSARAADPVALVTCAPGYPGSTAEAQPAMDALAAALARAAAWPAGSVTAVYLPTEKQGLDRLALPDAAAAIVTLPFFLQHARALGLVARLQVETQGAGLTERWSLVAAKGRVTGPGSLAGGTVTSLAGYAPGFVRGVLGPWGRIPESTRVVESSQVLSALRRAASAGGAAVLLDGAQSAALPSLPFAAELEVVARSAPLPTAIVASVGKRLPAARWSRLEKALLALPGDAQGAEALAGIRMVRFVRADAAAVAEARRLAEPVR